MKDFAEAFAHIFLTCWQTTYFVFRGVTNHAVHFLCFVFGRLMEVMGCINMKRSFWRG